MTAAEPDRGRKGRWKKKLCHSMTCIWRLYLVHPNASTFETQIMFSLYLLPPSFVKIPTLMMYTYLEIRHHTEAQICKAYCHPHHNCVCAHVFSAVVFYLEICQPFQRKLSPICALTLSLSWLSWPTVCGTHSSSQYLCASVYLFI